MVDGEPDPRNLINRSHLSRSCLGSDSQSQTRAGGAFPTQIPVQTKDKRQEDLWLTPGTEIVKIIREPLLDRLRCHISAPTSPGEDSTLSSRHG